MCSLAYNVLCLWEHEYLLCPNRGHNDEDDPGPPVYRVPGKEGWEEGLEGWVGWEGLDGVGWGWRGKTRRGERRGEGKGGG